MITPAVKEHLQKWKMKKTNRAANHENDKLLTGDDEHAWLHGSTMIEHMMGLGKGSWVSIACSCIQVDKKKTAQHCHVPALKLA